MNIVEIVTMACVWGTCGHFFTISAKMANLKMSGLQRHLFIVLAPLFPLISLWMVILFLLGIVKDKE